MGGVLQMEEVTYSVKETAELLGISESGVRRRIQKGVIKAEKVSNKYGTEYRILSSSIFPASQTIDVVKVENTLTLDDFRQAIQDEIEQAIQTVVCERERATTSLLEATNQKLDEQRDEITQLRNIIERMGEEKKSRSWWQRLIGK